MGETHALESDRLHSDHGGNGRGDGNGGAGVAPVRAHVGSVIDDLRMETIVAKALIESIRDVIADDDDLKQSAIEGETDIHEAIARAVCRLNDLKVLLVGIEHTIKALRERQDRFEKQNEMIREALRVAMETCDLKKVELPLGTISRKSVPPKADVSDESAIPARFWTPQPPKLDKRELLSALKRGETIPGAHLTNGSETLQVTFS